MQPHVIRLRGPWRLAVVDPVAATTGPSVAAPPATIQLPIAWSQLAGWAAGGRLRCARSFHRPTGLGPRSRVVLRAEAWPRSAAVFLNGRPLGDLPTGGGTQAWDVTDWLGESNLLRLELLEQEVGHAGEQVGDSPQATLKTGLRDVSDQASELVGVFWLEIIDG